MSIASELTAASALVNEKFNQMQTIGDTVYTTTMSAIQSLQSIANALEQIGGSVTLDTSGITMPTIENQPPTINEESLVFTPDSPPEPDGIIDANVFSNPPTFPSLSPGAVTSPESPTLNQTGFPTLSGTSPIVSGDTTYSSVLMEALKAKLYDDIRQGSTGIEPAIEDAIWRREEERALQALEDSLDRKASLWAEIGWDLPDGMLGAMFQEEQLTYLNSRLTTSRDVAIKSFELALQNAHFVIQQGVAFETMLITWINAVAQRALEASKATSDAQITKYREDINSATAQSNVDMARFKGDIDAKNINANTSKANIDALVAAHRENVNSVAAQSNANIETARAVVAYNAAQVQLFASRIDAYTAQINGMGMSSKAAAEAVNAKANVYQSTSNFLVGKGGLEVKVLDARLQQTLGNLGLKIRDMEVRAKNAEILGQLRVGAAEAIARIAAQLLAGAWSAVSAGATMGFKAELLETHKYEEESGQLTTPPAAPPAP